MTTPTSAAAKPIRKFGGLNAWQVARAILKESIANNVLDRAAGLAFYFLFALFPLLFLMITLFGLLTSYNVELENDLLSYFAGLLPPIAFQLIRSVTTEIAAQASSGKLIFGAVTAVWFISSSVSSMISFLNTAYHVSETRPWLKARGITFALSLLVTILLPTALLMVLAGGHLVNWILAGFRWHSSVIPFWQAIRWPTAIFLVALSCSLIYRYGPNLKEHRRRAWFTPGAAFGAFIWLIASLAFRIYLRFVDTYSVWYGSLGALMILLVWLYATGLAILIGAQINAGIELIGESNKKKPVDGRLQD